MSILNSIAKLYVRLVFRDTAEFDALKTQRDFNRPDPPRAIARRCERLDHDVRAYWIDKPNGSNGLLIYLHGGAFYFGPVKEHWQYLADICKRTGFAALMVDYGYGPQSPFPIGLNAVIDLVTTLKMPEHWVLGGDSSGAAMAVSTVFKLREMDKPLPKKLLLLSPWTDARLSNPDIDLNKHEDPMMTVERLSSGAKAYANGHDLADPLISPIYGDLDYLPPTLVQMGTADLLLADCRKFVRKCRAAGVDILYEEYPDTFHDFMMLGFLPEAKAALRSQMEFLVGK